MSEDQKLHKAEQPPKSQSFLRRNRIYFVAIAGFVALHITWYRLVETHVEEEDKPKTYPFTLLRKLDPFRTEEVKK